jgi:hypothetical protein
MATQAGIDPIQDVHIRKFDARRYHNRSAGSQSGETATGEMEVSANETMPVSADALCSETNCGRQRRVFRWPTEAADLVNQYREGIETNRCVDNNELRAVVTRLAEVSGNPRDACWRFIRQMGISRKHSYRPWTRIEQQRLLELIVSVPVAEASKVMRRSQASVRSMLHRLGASAKMGQDWFTKYTLAQALHIGVDAVQNWIDKGWLRCRFVETGSLKKQIIDADDFCEFCQRYGRFVVGRRLSYDWLSFIRDFVFPPSHAELLPVRESKKERAAFATQIGERKTSGSEDDFDAAGTDEPLEVTA